MPCSVLRREQLKVAGKKIIELVDCHVKRVNRNLHSNPAIFFSKVSTLQDAISCFLLSSQTPFLPFLLHWKKRSTRESSHHPSPHSPSNLQVTLHSSRYNRRFWS